MGNVGWYSVDSILSWLDGDAFEGSLTCSVNDIFTPDQEETDEMDCQSENMSAVTGESDMKEKPTERH